jgi:hypothetical protein
MKERERERDGTERKRVRESGFWVSGRLTKQL